MYQEDKKKDYIKIILRVVLFILIFVLVFKLLSMAFNSKKAYLDNNNMSHNLNELQSGAINYFKDNNIDLEDGSSTKISLNDLVDKEYVSELKDEYQFVCSKEDSYAEVLKTGNEYRVKSFLKCNNKEDYSYMYLDSLTKEEEINIEPTTEETTTTTTEVVTTTKPTTTKTTTTKTTKKEVVTTKTTTTTTTVPTQEPVVIPKDDRIEVSYDAKGGTINGFANYSTKLKKGVTITLPIPRREGYTFYYWYDSAGNRYTGDITIKDKLVLYAYWY